eukprot:COSAG02_NODE_586_length_19960_cov_13.442118_20_plen_81_part_00
MAAAEIPTIRAGRLLVDEFLWVPVRCSVSMRATCEARLRFSSVKKAALVLRAGKEEDARHFEWVLYSMTRGSTMLCNYVL